MPHSWIYRWYFRIHSGDGEQFQPNKFGCYQLPKQAFQIQCNGCFNCRCSHGAQQHGATSNPDKRKSKVVFLSWYFRIHSGEGERFFQPNKFGSTNSPKYLKAIKSPFRKGDFWGFYEKSL